MFAVGKIGLPRLPGMATLAELFGHGRWLHRRRRDLKSLRRRPVVGHVNRSGLVLVLLLGLGVEAAAQTPPGTVVSNQASTAFIGIGGGAELALSNQVDITTVVQRTPSVLILTRIVPANGSFTEPVGPALCAAGGGAFAPLPDPVLIGNQPVDPIQDQQLVSAGTFHAGEPVFIRVTDADQNLDPNLAETVDVTATSGLSGDSQLVRLTETGPNTGIFSGYLPTAGPPAVADNCILELAQDSDLDVNYTDVADPADIAAGTALVDPLGIVFDSQTGQVVDGAIVTLLDNTTGQPATIFGDDGVSIFPATVQSGGTATDSGGTLYSFPPGGFRFPLVAPGRYRLDIQPPAGYVAPSVSTIAELDLLPGAPYALGPGSFGQEFIISPGPIVIVDVPLDPFQGSLFLEKSTVTTIAAPGDFVEYALTLTNAGAGAANGVTVADILPVGFRFLPGSARLGGVVVNDPQVATDGRTLSFSVGDLAPGAALQLRYVTAITPAAQPGEAINLAIAQVGPDNQSNPARASVQIVDDLFRNESILVGRVVLGSCDLDVANDLEGVANVRVYLEDGRYVLTDDGGRYHFEGLDPGVHVVQVDLDSMSEQYEIEPCEDNSRFAGRAFSRFVDLQPGALWRADFHARQREAASGHVDLGLTQDVNGDRLDYRVTLSGASLAIEKLTAMVMLPAGVALTPGSVRLGDKALADPRRHGNVLTFDLGSRQGAWQERLSLSAEAAPTAGGNLVTRAVARFSVDGESEQTSTAETRAFRRAGTSLMERYVFSLEFATLSAELALKDRAKLNEVVDQWRNVENVHLRATGHSDSVPIAARNRQLFSDNYALSRARAASVAQFVREGLALMPGRISYRGLGPDQPVADNTTEQGRQENRRVELEITGLRADKDPELKSVQNKSEPVRHKVVLDFGNQESAVEGDVEAEVDEFNVAAAVNRETDVAVESLVPGVGFVSPATDYSPPIPSIKVAFKHRPGNRVELILNGEPVSGLNFDGAEISADQQVALTRWRGIDLKDGPNQLLARVTGGDQVTDYAHEVHFAGPPIRGRLVEEKSLLVADGQQRPIMAVEFVDRWGRPARRGTLGGFSVDPPYRSWWEVSHLKENQLVFSGDRSPTYRVGEDGVALIELEPTAQAGQVRLHLQYDNDRGQEIESWLKPDPRDWILVGLAEGTLGYNSVSDNLQLAEESGFEEDYYDDGRLAFFAKGRIKGEFLLTLGFDSSRRRSEEQNELFGVIDPDRFYLLYGDGAEQRFEAPSQRKLYVKLERNAFVALFGDYETGLTVTELSRYSRALNGFKSEFHGQRASYNLFAASTDQAFIKDELPGDGTSGPYRLSRSSIVLNSESITLETRDRFRSELVLDSRKLQRHLHYNIDYLAGTIFFKEPIRSRDVNFNPITVVVDYESRDGRGDSTVAGGRGALHFADNKVELGVSAIREGVAGGDGDLWGADLRFQVTDATELKAELAHSEVDNPGLGVQEGDAYLVELTHRAGPWDARGYMREQEGQFGLGQQRGTESGTRKAGLDARAQFGEYWQLSSEVFRQENLDTSGVRDAAQAEVRFNDNKKTATLGARHVADQIPGQQDLESDQAFVGASWRLWDDLLTARVNLETALGGSNDSVDYPTRSLLGLDLAVNNAITVFGEYEISDGASLDTQMTRIGIRANPWQRTQINTTFNREMTENGPRTFANLGLVQAWQVNERWAVDFGLDQANTMREPGLTPFDVDVPLASGNLSNDFSAAFIGALYRDEDWTFSTRLERRDSDNEDRTVWDIGFYRERREGRGFSARLNAIHTSSITGLKTTGGDLSLGWAHRPAMSRWIVLNRIDVISERRQDLLSDLRTARVVNNLNANWVPNRRSQIALQYAAKYVRANFSGFTATGYIDLWGAEWRRDLNQRFDLGLHGSVYRAPELGIGEYGLGIDLGISLAENIWISFGYNFSGFDDEDFSRNRYTAQGPFLRLRMKVDQASLKSLLGH